MDSLIIRNMFKYIVHIVFVFRLLPHFILLHLSKNKKIIFEDLVRWTRIYKLKPKFKNLDIAFYLIMKNYPEFRNLFYYCVKKENTFYGFLMKFLCKPIDTLFLNTDDIGAGLFLQHCFSTIIVAEKIGKNCWINQQVTIGFSNDNACPKLENNVTVGAGAKILGGITIGANSIIGANAVVVKDVPPNCTVVGVPAYIIKKNGVSVKESLT